jgi:hypothetical protein
MQAEFSAKAVWQDLYPHPTQILEGYLGLLES